MTDKFTAAEESFMSEIEARLRQVILQIYDEGKRNPHIGDAALHGVLMVSMLDNALWTMLLSRLTIEQMTQVFTARAKQALKAHQAAINQERKETMQ